MKVKFLLCFLFSLFILSVKSQVLSEKYHVLFYIGNSLTEVQNNLCTAVKNAETGSNSIKANIMSVNKYPGKSVLKIGNEYYYVSASYDYRNSDEDQIGA